MEIPKKNDSQRRRGTLVNDDNYEIDNYTGRLKFQNLEELHNVSQRYINDISNNGDAGNFTSPCKPIEYIPGMDSSMSGSERNSWDCRASPSSISQVSISPKINNLRNSKIYDGPRMVRLIYTSKMCLIYNNVESIQKINLTANHNNNKYNVGGELFWSRDSGRILQILEGLDSNVNEIYKKISEDERHQDIKLLNLQEITQDDRQYQKWDVTITKKLAEKSTLQDWKITSIIGMGAYGTVVAVENNDSKKICAMKLIPKKRLTDKSKNKLIAERQFMEQLKHPFLTKLYHTFEDPLNIYFVMKFAARGDLFRYLSVSKTFSEEQSKFYLCELLCGLVYLHKNGIIYGDLKLENILIEDNGHLMLTDFGISTTILDNQKELVGTIVYFSPELIKDKLRCQENDIWALGILFYELLVGSLPWQSMSRYEACKSNINTTLELEEQNCNDFLQRILVKDYKQRPRCKDIMKHDPYLSDVDWNAIYKKEISPPNNENLPDKLVIHSFGE